MSNRRPRKNFSKRTKYDAWVRSNGHCEAKYDGKRCSGKLRPGQFDYHHDLETGMGGEATLENCVVACKACHTAITKARAPVMAKVRRTEEKHLGIKKETTWRKPKGMKFNWKRGRYESLD